jgi:serine/threonine-protein kinase
MQGTFANGDHLGPYEILSLVGMNMGELYRAHDPRLGRDVALKVFFTAGMSNEELEEMRCDFEREMHVVKALDNHPSIMNLHDVGVWEGRLYVVWDFIEGRSLREHLNEKRLTQERALNYALQIARVLAVAQERGIAHGDLTPANIIISGEDRVQILGFGKVSSNSPSDDRVEPLLGSCSYLPPERIAGEKWDYRADIFSFGLVLYEMLIGEHPFLRTSLAETARAIWQDDPVPPRKIDRGISRHLNRLVKGCLAKDPAKRFQSAHKLVAELERAFEQCS